MIVSDGRYFPSSLPPFLSYSLFPSFLDKNKRTNNIQQLRIGNDHVQDSNIISNYFNYCFCSIGLSYHNKFNQINSNDFKYYLPPPFKNSIYCFPVSKDEKNKIISKIQNKNPWS